MPEDPRTVKIPKLVSCAQPGPNRGLARTPRGGVKSGPNLMRLLYRAILLGVASMGTAGALHAAARGGEGAPPTPVVRDGAVRVSWSANVHQPGGQFVVLRVQDERREIVGRVAARDDGWYIVDDRSGSGRRGDRRYVLLYVDAAGQSRQLAQQLVAVEQLHDAPASALVITSLDPIELEPHAPPVAPLSGRTISGSRCAYEPPVLAIAEPPPERA